jgi:hypothetical protein
MINANRWDVVHAKQLGSIHATMAGDYSIFRIEQNRTDESELLNAGGNLFDLLRGMSTGIAWARVELRGVFIRDLETSHVAPPKA